MRVLVTGGAGFIGSNLVRHLLRERDDIEVVNLDLLTYAGNPDSLADVQDHPRYTFVQGDICDAELVAGLAPGLDAILHLAAESHVDRSIRSDAPFVRTNVLGTHTLLAAALAAGVKRFVHVSTDEVYGELPWRSPDSPEAPAATDDAPRFHEESPVRPRSPYAASKAASDHLALAYHITHGLDVIVTRASNNYGPYQFPEKLIPLVLLNALEGKDLPVYGDGLHVRDWLHVEDHCRGLLAALQRGRPGRVYNLGGNAERTNLQVVRRILELVGRSEDLIRYVPDRPGHDRRYALDTARAADELGWLPEHRFDEGLAETVSWYRQHEAWWRPLRNGEYWRYYADHYGDRA